MSLATAIPTYHAWQRFIERWPGPPPEDYREALAELLRDATEEDLGGGTVHRLIDNQHVPARYFSVDGWRFVTTEDAARIITIERIHIRAKKKRRKIKDPRRYGK